MNLKNCLYQTISWAREAGAFQKERFGTELTIERKSSQTDLVTEVDKGSEQIILANIRRAFPEHGILAEETGRQEGNSDYCWVVDPLDGTTNYAQGLPIFAVSIALQHQGHSVLGVVYAPMTDQLYAAVLGEGAFVNGKPIRVGAKEKLMDCVLATGFPYDSASHPDNNANYASHLIPKLRGIRRMGAAAYDLCQVASGTMDGYWELGLAPWDVAAGSLIVTEAGGVVQPWAGKRGNAVIAGNSKLVHQINRELAWVDVHGISLVG